MVHSRSDERMTRFQSLMCGGAAGILCRSATSPLEVVKVLAQVGTVHTKQGIYRTFVNVYRNEGVKAFWKGNWITCLRLFPYSALQFITFNNLVTFLEDPHQGYLTNTGSILAGLGSTLIAMLAVYPCDVVRTRLIVQHVKPSLTKYRGIRHAFKTMWKEEGLFALYKGLLPSVLGILPFAGGSFMVYHLLDRTDYIFDNYTSTTQIIIGSCLAAAFAQGLSYPFDTIRKKMQARSMHIPGGGGVDIEYKGMCDAFVQTVKVNGFAGLWKGLTANLLKICPNNFLMFLSFEHCRRIVLYHNGYTLSPWECIPRDDVDQSLLPHEVKMQHRCI